jgi:hypothetical protein
MATIKVLLVDDEHTPIATVSVETNVIGIASMIVYRGVHYSYSGIERDGEDMVVRFMMAPPPYVIG